jgi:hypothetical protein
MNRILSLILSSVLCASIAACQSGDEQRPSAPVKVTLTSILSTDTVNPWESCLPEAPNAGCRRMRFKPLGPLRKVFCDSNYIQIGAARALGIDPIETDDDIMKLKRPLVHIASCKQYYIDDLTHSFPFLVPEAAELLQDIGQAFNDSLAARGGGRYRIKVTSVLRTPVTVKRLRRVNGNASSESTHMYGTTFDISHSKFICDGTDQPARSFEDLKNLLAAVLYDLRSQGRCYVMYEVKQSCFHVTTRPSDGIEYPAPKPEPKPQTISTKKKTSKQHAHRKTTKKR